MITVKRLPTPELIEEACALLFDVYIEQMKWKFNPDNPSMIRVETRNNRKMLIDRFTERAIWFGAFDDEKLVGCIRLCGVDENNKLEIEGYPNSYLVLQHIPNNRKECVEITKMAIKQEYREQGVIKKLLLPVFNCCENNQLSVFMSIHDNYLKTLFQKIEFPLLIEQAFKYEDHDPYPVNFYFADYKKLEVNTIKKNLEYLENDLTSNAFKIFRALEMVAPMVPNPFYWMDANGIVLGANEACLKGMGATRDLVIGKKPYDFYKKETADHILQHDAQVIRSGEVSSQEEPFEDVTTKQLKYFLSVKSPLYDDNGTIIGIIGSSTDITAEKEAERLKDEAIKAKLEAQEKFKKIAFQVAHDITSPVIALTMFTETYADELPEDLRYFLKDSATRINDIAYNLLNQYKSQVTAVAIDDEKQEDLLLSSSLLKILAEKKFQYAGLPVQFDFIAQKKDYFAFIHIQPNAFKRSLSNIINNAVDAFEHKAGAVILKLDTDEQFVNIIIEDNGKGMPEEIRNKIMNNLEVTAGKADGHGIGMGQVRDTLTNNNGKMQIDSELGKGTRITLIFPRIDTPDWIVDQINLSVDDTLLILDDDDGIHRAWDKRFGVDAPNISIKHFTYGQEAIDYVNGLPLEQKEKLFLLTDYELLKQKVNGLQVIEQTGLKRSILVTSHFENEKVRELADKTKTKILPKPLASEVPIIIVARDGAAISVAKESKKADLVLIDDDEKFVKLLMLTLFGGLTVDYYLSPTHFLEECSKYPKNIKICLDKNFTNDIDGVALAKKLHEQGFSQIFLVTGEYMDKGQFPAYLTIVHKSEIDKLKTN